MTKHRYAKTDESKGFMPLCDAVCGCFGVLKYGK